MRENTLTLPELVTVPGEDVYFIGSGRGLDI